MSTCVSIYLYFKKLYVSRSELKYAYLDIFYYKKYDDTSLNILWKNTKYAIVFLLANTSKYAYVCWQCIYMEIRLYLIVGIWTPKKFTLMLAKTAYSFIRSVFWIIRCFLVNKFAFAAPTTNIFLKISTNWVSGHAHWLSGFVPAPVSLTATITRCRMHFGALYHKLYRSWTYNQNVYYNSQWQKNYRYLSWLLLF